MLLYISGGGGGGGGRDCLKQVHGLHVLSPVAPFHHSYKSGLNFWPLNRMLLHACLHTKYSLWVYELFALLNGCKYYNFMRV